MDEQFVFVPDGNVIKCVDTKDGRVVRRLAGHVDCVNGCVFRKDALELCSTGHDLHTILWKNRGSLTNNRNDFEDEVDYWSD